MAQEISSEIIHKTQKHLGKYVKKPALSEKLLKKPPFRFLQDIIAAVIKETGFLKGVFTERELTAEGAKDKEAKIAFLTKLIDAINSITKANLTVKPSKIVAGLEPAETNVLLQTIAKALDKKLDSSDYVKKIHSNQNLTSNDKRKKKSLESVAKSSKTSIKNEKISKLRPEKKQGANESPKSTERSKSKVKLKARKNQNEGDLELEKAESSNKTSIQNEGQEGAATDNIVDTDNGTSKQLSEPAEIQNSTLIHTKQDSEKLQNEDQYEHHASHVNTIQQASDIVKEEKKENTLIRPKSARPKSGDKKDKPAPSAVIDESVFSTLETSLIAASEVGHPRNSLRPPSVRPSSARPGAPRLRPESALPTQEIVPMGKINVIIENVDKDADEEETVVIQNTPDLLETHSEMIDMSVENKGHLVEQILEQITDSDGEIVRQKLDPNWEDHGFHDSDASTKEIKQLRVLIQALTRTANPLGKLLNYLHEDIDAMHNELEIWTNSKRQLYMEIAKQKRMNVEANIPILNQLETLQQDILKEQQEILSIRSNILKNENKIRELLIK